MRAAVFLDKDGTLIEDVPYNVDPARITLMAGAREFCARLHAAGYMLVVVTNQSGIARGLFDEEALDGVERRLRTLLETPLAAFLYCPHGADDGCGCRKPAPGLIQGAAQTLGIDLARSWMIGDILNDVEAGARAGCRTILLDNGGETEWLAGSYRTPTTTVRNLEDAAAAILSPMAIAA